MTRKQYDVTKKLADAEAEFLQAYGWTLASSLQGATLWTHRRRPGTRYPQRDALFETRANTLEFS